MCDRRKHLLLKNFLINERIIIFCVGYESERKDISLEFVKALKIIFLIIFFSHFNNFSLPLYLSLRLEVSYILWVWVKRKFLVSIKEIERSLIFTSITWDIQLLNNFFSLFFDTLSSTVMCICFGEPIPSMKRWEINILTVCGFSVGFSAKLIANLFSVKFFDEKCIPLFKMKNEWKLTDFYRQKYFYNKIWGFSEKINYHNF